jgi:hypothetical protein
VPGEGSTRERSHGSSSSASWRGARRWLCGPPALRASLKQIDHDALEVLAFSNGLGAQLFSQGAPELEREHEPDIARRRSRLRAARDGNLGRLLGLNTTASLRRWRQGKFGLVASCSPGSRASPSAHVEVPGGSASGIAEEPARAPAPSILIMAAGRRRTD